MLPMLWYQGNKNNYNSQHETKNEKNYKAFPKKKKKKIIHSEKMGLKRDRVWIIMNLFCLQTTMKFKGKV